MRYFSSRLFVAGLVLMAGGILSVPLFVTALPGDCSIPSPSAAAPSSWDCFQPVVFDVRIPMSFALSGIVLILVGAVRIRRAS